MVVPSGSGASRVLGSPRCPPCRGGIRCVPAVVIGTIEVATGVGPVITVTFGGLAAAVLGKAMERRDG